jgi:hypothetical protein
MIDENVALPPQWKEYLENVWLKEDREGFIEFLGDMEENIEWYREQADFFLSENDFELHLYFKEHAEEREIEAEYMRKLLDSA